MNEKLKIIRNAVRCFYIKDGKVIAIKTKENSLKSDFFDIPGGGIENNETMEEAAIREFKEEAGLDIKNPVYRGVINVVFTQGIYKLNTFIVDNYSGTFNETEEHIPYLIDINEVINAEKRFACTIMLEPSFLKVLLDKTKTFELTVHTSDKEVVSSINFIIKDI